MQRHIEAYLRELRISGKAESTLGIKGLILGQWATYMNGRTAIRQDLLDYTETLVGRQCADSYVRLQQRTIKAFYSWLAGITGENPLEGVPLRTVKSVPKKVDVVDLENKIDSLLQGTPQEHLASARRDGNAWRELRNWALCSLCLDAGLRAHEAVGLSWRQVDLDAGVIRVERSKTGFREVPCTSRLVEKLSLWRSATSHEPADWVFPTTRAGSTHLSVRGFIDVVKRLGASTHDFRRGCITRAWNAGVPIQLIQAQVGHHSVITTQGYVTQDLNATRTAFEAVC